MTASNETVAASDNETAPAAGFNGTAAATGVPELACYVFNEVSNTGQTLVNPLGRLVKYWSNTGQTGQRQRQGGVPELACCVFNAGRRLRSLTSV
jgi:hypothetical protein